MPTAPARILVVDDEPDLRTLYELTLLRDGHHVSTAANLAQASALLASQRFDVLITDMRLPDGLGMALLHELHQQQRQERSIVITAYGSAENAVEALRYGAFDYLTKPVDLKQFRRVVASATEGLPAPNTPAAPALATPACSAFPPCDSSTHPAACAALERLAGQSPAMQLLRQRIQKVAPSMAPVLITGESGTGKELVARALHACSHRSHGPWVAVNCGAIPEHLLEAEFFGARKGAFTGANADRQGFFQAANGGTLFLDELGELPLAMQAKLLRAIQERSVRALGATQEEGVDVRIISATHRNLANDVQTGRFRQDLFYRLNVIDVQLPALRERREDLPLLCERLLANMAQENGLSVPPPTWGWSRRKFSTACSGCTFPTPWPTSPCPPPPPTGTKVGSAPPTCSTCPPPTLAPDPLGPALTWPCCTPSACRQANTAPVACSNCLPTSLTGQPTRTLKAFAAWKCRPIFSSPARAWCGSLSAPMTAPGMPALRPGAGAATAMTTRSASSSKGWRAQPLPPRNTAPWRGC